MSRTSHTVVFQCQPGPARFRQRCFGAFRGNQDEKAGKHVSDGPNFDRS